MDEDTHPDLQKVISDNQMDADEGPLINENSNGLSHLLTENEFNSVDAVPVDESSTSNQAFLNAVELTTGSTNDYLDNNSEGFHASSFDVGDNAVTFPSETLNHVFSDDNSHLSDGIQTNNVVESDSEVTESQLTKMDTTDVVTDSEGPVEELSKDRPHEENSLTNVIEDSKDESNTLVEEDQTNNFEDVTESNQEEATTESTVQEAKENKSEEETTNSEVGGAGETEVVSEDELPEVEKPSIKDAENVSDDELPGPKPADLPADTEVVSEDELPSAKKESRKRKNDEEKDGYDPGSPTSETESANKKQAVVKNGESKPIAAEKRTSVDEKPKKTLPELDKYWKVVNDDPTDFTGWTYLLQYVDQESDVEAAREAYDAFLSHYPYCYGYWRKFADYEKRKGSKKKCLEVLERGLRAIPLSVDLWIHYLNHIKTTRADDVPYVRSQYERAIEICGLEFRSDRLWESYVKWEAEHGTPLQVTAVYDRLLATPTLGYTTHFDNFQEHVMSSPISSVITREELIRLRGEVRAAAAAPPPPLDLPPGEDEPPDHVASEEEGQAIKERVITARRKVHKATGEEVAARWSFEEGIKRPYFHVKPLERCQLKNWKCYLEWERQHGSFKRALLLHERCLIACALYDDFWMRLIKFLEENIEKDPSLIPLEREVLERACTVHHLDKPDLHLHWAHFEEAHGNVAKAAEILERIEKVCPTLVLIQYRRANLERRRGDLDKCSQLYEHYINTAKSKPVSSALAIKYARFLLHVKKDPAAAKKVLDDAVAKEPLNPRLYLQRLDLALHQPDTPYSELEELVSAYEKQTGAELEQCAAFAWRRRELAEELGGAAAAAAAAHHHRALTRHLRKRHRKEGRDTAAATTSTSTETKKKESTNASSVTPAANATGGSYYQAPSGTPYDQSYTQGYQQPPWGYQQPGGYPPPHGWPQYPPNYY